MTFSFCARRLPTTGKIIAELKFAFWENIFTAGQDSRLWNAHFRTFFPGAPLAQTTSAARKPMLISRPFGTCAIGSPTTSQFLRNLANDYQRIHDMIAWRSPTAAAWMDGKQTVMALIAQKP
jgi:hypothetical protein